MPGSEPNRYQKSLEGIDFFQGIPEAVRVSIERRCRWQSVGANERIIEYLDDSDDIFFLVSGKARVMMYSASGRVVAFHDLKSGKMFGEYAAIDRGVRSASVEALEPCQLASMSSSVFWELLAEQPTFTKFVMRHLVEEIRTLTRRVFEFSTLAVRNRTQAELLRLAREAPPTSNTAHVKNAPTHEEIASRISTHRQAVTTELNRLAQIGLIEQRARTLIVKDVARLQRMVSEATGE
jgi:CRP/FNR family cyclic AMP-dependent transcriptional regulator